MSKYQFLVALPEMVEAALATARNVSIGEIDSFDMAWKGDGDVWKQLEGFDRRKTPLSDHLMVVFTDWRKPFVGLVPDFELLFERFEMLGSLAHFEGNEKSAVRTNLEASAQQGRVWTPTGRSGWHESTASKLISEFQGEPTKGKLLEAGFAKGDAELLALFIENFKRIASRMSWM